MAVCFLSAGIRCIGGLDVIRKEAWPFYRKISGVRLYWVLAEPKGPNGPIRCEPHHMAAKVGSLPKPDRRMTAGGRNPGSPQLVNKGNGWRKLRGEQALDLSVLSGPLSQATVWRNGAGQPHGREPGC